MIEVFLIQSLFLMIPIFMAIAIWLLIDIVLDIINKHNEKSVAKAYCREKPIDKTKEYFNV